MNTNGTAVCLVMVAVVTVATGCDTLLRAPVVQSGIGREAALLRWQASPFRAVSADRRLFESRIEREEYAGYLAGNEARGEVVLLQARGSRVALSQRVWMREPATTIDEWAFNRGHADAVEPLGRTAIGSRPLLLSRYRHVAENRECVAFTTGRDPREDRRPEGIWRARAMILFGYYCAPPGEDLTNQEGRAIVEGLSVRDYDYDYAAGPGPEDQRPAVPSEDVGPSGFPYRIAERYSDRDDDERLTEKRQ